MGGGVEADLGVLAAAQPPPRQQGDPNCGKQSRRGGREAWRPGSSLVPAPERLCDLEQVSSPFWASLLFSHLCNERGGLKSGFKLCLMKP